MGPELVVAGTALRLAFTEFWNAVKEVKHRVKDFRPQLEELERTLRILEPVVQDIERMSTQLNDEAVERLKSIIVPGKKLVSKCHGVSWWNLSMMAYRQKKLVELDNKLRRFNVKYLLPIMFREVRSARLEQSSGFSRISDQIESLRPSAAGDAAGGGGPIHSRPLIPPQLPNRAPTALVPLPPPNNRAPGIDTLGLMLFVIFPSIHVVLKIIAMIIIIYKAVTSIISIFEKSESEIGMMIKDVGGLETTLELLDATMNSLAPVLEQIESNEADPSEDAERLKSLLEEGEKLFRNRSNIRWWNFVEKWQCQNKMVELDNKLLRFHSLYLLARLAKNSDDDSEMKDHESFEPSAHYDQDLYEIKGRHMDTREYESYDMLNGNPHQFLCYKKPPISSSIGGFQHHALGR